MSAFRAVVRLSSSTVETAFRSFESIVRFDVDVWIRINFLAAQPCAPVPAPLEPAQLPSHSRQRWETRIADYCRKPGAPARSYGIHHRTWPPVRREHREKDASPRSC